MGYVYLIQPEEYIGTNVLKIGMSTKNNCERIYKGYGKDHKIILLRHTLTPDSVEKEIKKIFNEKFILEKGYEYFQGDVNDMEKTFLQIISTIVSDYNFEEEDEDFDEEEHIKECLTNIQFKDPYKLEMNFKAKYFLDFDIKNPSLKIKIRIPSVNPKDGYYVEVNNGYRYYMYDRYTVSVFDTLIEKNELLLNKEYDIFDKDFLKRFDEFQKNIDDEILEYSYDVLFDLQHLYYYGFDYISYMFLTYPKHMDNEIKEFNEKIDNLKEKYEKLLKMEDYFEKKYMYSFTYKMNKHEFYNQRDFINKVKNRVEIFLSKIPNIDSLNKLRDKLSLKLYIVKKNYIYYKIQEKIYNTINIIHNIFSFIKVNNKYPISILDSYDDEKKKFYVFLVNWDTLSIMELPEFHSYYLLK